MTVIAHTIVSRKVRLGSSHMACLAFSLFSSILFVCVSGNAVIYPLNHEQGNLATRINCKVGESRNFRYSSVTNLWGSLQGQIALNGDVDVYCLGNDAGGRYGDEALKYLVELSNFKIEERSHSDPSEQVVSYTSKRRKRGIGDFFKDTWKKIKNFFSRMFGSGGSEEQGTSRDNGGRETEVSDGEDKSSAPPGDDEEEGENSMNYDPLYSLPFEFVQLANGSIPEVRFSAEETDGRVRNFKRHVVDSFATQLAMTQEMTKETSVIGEHLTNYSVTVHPHIPESFVSDGAYTSLLVDRDSETLDENHVLVEKVITEEDILNLAANQQSAALNDRDKMGLKSEQKQIFVSGKLVSSTGKSSISLFPPTGKQRKKRSDGADDEDDVRSYFQALSEFELKLEKRKRRRSVSSQDIQALQQKSMTLTAASRFAEAEDSSAKQKLKDFQNSVGNTTAFMESLLNTPPTKAEKLQTVFEMVEEEVRLGLDHESHSMAIAVRKTLSQEKMLPLCKTYFSRCRDFLQLLSLAGGPEAEQVLLSCLSTESGLDVLMRQQVADIVSEVSHPSDRLLSALISRLENREQESGIRGALCLSAATIAAQSPDQAQKTKMAEVLVTTLEEERSKDCSHNPLVLDLLEAAGNLGHASTVDYILKTSEACSGKMEIQIACAHALRHLSTAPEVQQWMLKAITSQPCDVVRAVIGSLLDEIGAQEKERDLENWPRNDFNDIDTTLKVKLQSSSDDFRCAREDALRYFRKKRDRRAKMLIKEVYSDDAEAWNPGSSSRQKRDLWDKLNCKEWTKDTAYRPIQDQDEFASDRAKYNFRKSCLASRTLGVRGANAEVYAGMFAGVKDPSDPPEYKLFTKFVTGLNFLDHQTEIGSFYFYHHSGNTKAYVRIMGRTRQEFTHEGCTPTELRYRPITHIPLFLVTVSVVQLSLGVHLSSQLSLDTLCPGNEIYNLQPLSNVRVGGEAMGTVFFARGSLNLGGNFNYQLHFTFSPQPYMCLSGQHGYDPMSISIEAFFQMWNVAKSDWGKHRTWKPNSLKWEVSNGRRRQWFNDTCVLRMPSAGTGGPATSAPSDENDVVEFIQ